MENKIEVWKKVKNQNDYEVSNFGRIKSLKLNKEKILKPTKNNRGYLIISFCNNGVSIEYSVHQVVAENFLNHKTTKGLHINHIDFDKTNNNLSNLEIITHRENCNRKHIKSSSKYVGVNWSKQNSKWLARISVNNKTIYLGYFITEKEASNAYENYKAKFGT